MIQDYAADMAAQIGIQKLKVSLVNGIRLGCKDMHLVNLGSMGKYVSTLVFQSDLNSLQSASECVQLEIKIRSALDRLKMLLET
jgi:hypothetical protein